MAREFAKQFYRSKEWENVRDGILMRDKYMCVKCGAATDLEVHHKIYLTPQNINDISITLNPDNLITLCHDCHHREHKGQHGKGRKQEEDYPYTFDENGMLIPKPPR